MKGVMECIKYHFKTDSIVDENGNYDVPLIADILNNSKGLRFYSKFGAFYKEELLNFDKTKQVNEDSEDVQLLEDEATAENINGSITNSINNLINPFTNSPAIECDYTLTVAVPETLRYSGSKCIKPFELLNFDCSLFTPIADKNASLADIVKLMTHSKLHTILAPKPDKKKNRQHTGYYELDFFLAESNMVFEVTE